MKRPHYHPYDTRAQRARAERLRFWDAHQSLYEGQDLELYLAITAQPKEPHFTELLTVHLDD